MLEIHDSIQDLHVRSDLARYLALIVTELVINAAKYAFAGDGSGLVTVELVSRTSQVGCIVRDNDVGAPPDRDCALSQGMKLADKLATQSGGHCRWLFTRAGTEVVVLLPLDPPPGEPARLGRSTVSGAF